MYFQKITNIKELLLDVKDLKKKYDFLRVSEKHG